MVGDAVLWIPKTLSGLKMQVFGVPEINPVSKFSRV
jgi:hypothetical protein